MREILRQARSELRLLPLMLGKLAGGVMAAVGAGAAVAMLGNRPGTTPSDALPYAVVAVAGIIVFTLCSKRPARRSANAAAEAGTPAAAARTRLIAWSVLLLLAAGFLLVAFLLTR